MARLANVAGKITGGLVISLYYQPLLVSQAQTQPLPSSGDASDLGILEVSLKDVVTPNIGFQGALQGAGTPNQAGIGGYYPLSIGENNVFFVDVLANVNFSDYEGYSSIINTEVDGVTISTSSRLGYRWLNNDRSWMFGVNAGYDSRPMNTGNSNQLRTFFKNDVFFQQIAAGLEAVSNDWDFNAYALVPVGTSEYVLNNYFSRDSNGDLQLGRHTGGALSTYGLDVGYRLADNLVASVGYYYQKGDQITAADGSGVDLSLSYEAIPDLFFRANLSYDEAFETRVSGTITYRFTNYNNESAKKKVYSTPVLASLSDTIDHRDVRVHDKGTPKCQASCVKNAQAQKSKVTSKVSEIVQCSAAALQGGADPVSDAICGARIAGNTKGRD